MLGSLKFIQITALNVTPSLFLSMVLTNIVKKISRHCTDLITALAVIVLRGLLSMLKHNQFLCIHETYHNYCKRAKKRLAKISR